MKISPEIQAMLDSFRCSDARRYGVAANRLAAAEYWVSANDPKRFEACLLRYSPAERAVIVQHIKRNRDRS